MEVKSLDEVIKVCEETSTKGIATFSVKREILGTSTASFCKGKSLRSSVSFTVSRPIGNPPVYCIFSGGKPLDYSNTEEAARQLAHRKALSAAESLKEGSVRLAERGYDFAGNRYRTNIIIVDETAFSR